MEAIDANLLSIIAYIYILSIACMYVSFCDSFIDAKIENQRSASCYEAGKRKK